MKKLLLFFLILPGILFAQIGIEDYTQFLRQGPNIYAFLLNQNLRTTDSPTFAGLTLSGGTASTLAYLNASKAFTSLANGNGYLLNDGSGGLSWGAVSFAGYLKADGTVPLTANWDAGNYQLSLKNVVMTNVVSGGSTATVSASTCNSGVTAMSGSVSATNAYGVYANAQSMAVGGTASITNAYGVYATAQATRFAGTASITNAYGVYIADTGNANATNRYQLYIEPVTKYSTVGYSIYSDGIKSLPNATSPILNFGYLGNSISGASTAGSAILGGGKSGEANIIVTSPQSVIVGGEGNTIDVTGVSGGSSNIIGGGLNNLIEDSSWYGGIFSGELNRIWDSLDASLNPASHDFIGGGKSNEIDSHNSSDNVIAGGESNRIYGNGLAAILGGQSNTAWHYCTVGGGFNNTAGSSTNNYATVVGGLSNTASGAYSFAAGKRAKATHDGSVVFSDSTDADFLSIANNEFAVRASGGFRVDTGHIYPTATSVTAGSGTGLTVNSTGNLNRQVYKVTVTYAGFSADATHAHHVICTLPAKTRIVSIISDTTTKYVGGAVSAATLEVGKTTDTGVEYILAHDVFTAAVTKGLADADLGDSINRANAVQGGDIPSWSATTDITATIRTTDGNTSAFTQGATTFYITTERF